MSSSGEYVPWILDIGLGEDTTAGCHRINVLGVHSQLADFLVIYSH